MAELKVSVLPGLRLSIEIVDMTEVLYEDFLYYLGEALGAGTKDEQLHKRHLRAALQALFCYHEARLNGYVSHILTCAKKKTKAQVSTQLPKLSVKQKIDIVVSCYNTQCALRANEVSENISTMKSLRNSLSHFYQGDFHLMEAVTLRNVGETASSILEWQCLVEASLGLLPKDIKVRLHKVEALQNVIRQGLAVLENANENKQA